MKISREFPPHFDLIEAAFPLVKEMQAVFCWGDTIYSPFSEEEIRPDLMAHEQVHSFQQGSNPFAWWVKYIEEPKFRLLQELEACGAQVKYVRDMVKNEPEGAKLIEYCLSESAKTLASPLYGGLVTENEARCKIRNLARATSAS